MDLGQRRLSLRWRHGTVQTVAPTATRSFSRVKAAGSDEPLVRKRCGGCGCSCPPQRMPARRSGPGFRATRLPVRESTLRRFCARCRQRCCAAAAWLSYHGRNRPPCVAACSWGVLIGNCGPIRRYSWSTAVSLMPARLRR